MHRPIAASLMQENSNLHVKHRNCNEQNEKRIYKVDSFGNLTHFVLWHISNPHARQFLRSIPLVSEMSCEIINNQS